MSTTTKGPGNVWEGPASVFVPPEKGLSENLVVFWHIQIKILLVIRMNEWTEECENDCEQYDLNGVFAEP